MNYWLVLYDFDSIGPELQTAFAHKKFKMFSNKHLVTFGDILDKNNISYLRSHVIIDIEAIDSEHFVVSKFRLYMPSMP